MNGIKTGIKIGAVIAGAVLLFGGCLSTRIPKAEINRGSESKLLEWKTVVEQALENNSDLEAARSDIEASARSRDIAAGDYLPSVSGNLERDRLRTTNTAPTHDSLGLGITAEQSLFNGFDTTGKFLGAKKDLEAAKWSYLDTSANVRFRLRSAYVELLKLKKLVEVNRKIAERRKKNADTLQPS